MCNKILKIGTKELLLPQIINTMNLHEFQGKEILNSFGVQIQTGIVATHC